MEVALKIDVDTHDGLKLGVPRLARMLREEGVAASFFVAMGPDNSGRAVFRVFRNKGFLVKMRRTRALTMYGLRTVLSGTLLPARPIARAFPEILRALVRDGFELGVHGYDHVRWQDGIDRLGAGGIGSELKDAFAAYREILGRPATSFAAPGWRTSAMALRALDAMGLDYRSDTRGRAPFLCALDGELLKTPEIPTTLPTLDEVLGIPELPDDAAVLRFFLARFRADTLNVHTAHAETEGGGSLELFRALVRALKERGAVFLKLCEVARRLMGAELPVCQVVRTTLAGRAGWISAQGPEQARCAPAA